MYPLSKISALGKKKNFRFSSTPHYRISAKSHCAHSFIVTALLGLLFNGNSYAAPSFPNFPLTSGAGNKVPHNAMLILDDSGSMEWSFMPTVTLANNNDWKNPQSGGTGEVTWLCYTGADGKNYTTRKTAKGLWYWDGKGAGGAGLACDNPSRYLEGTWEELKRFDNGMMRSYYNNSIYYNPNKTYLPWRTKEPLPEDPALSPERLANADITKVSNHASDLTGELDLRNSPHAVFFVPNVSPSSGHVYFRPSNPEHYYKYRVGTNGNGDAVIERCNAPDTSQCIQNSNNWVADTPTMLDKNGRPLPKISHTPRSQSEELQNFANWFHYHSTRMKMAKAGASEALGSLKNNIRVGYDAINSNAIILPIPGRFENTNRSNFYDKLHNQNAAGNTPLRQALERTGEYYKTEQPYKNSSGTELSCIRNYAILVTDGGWTADQSKFPSLNQVAHHYWSQDLRPIPDNVPPSGDDYADWQHMNTIGISVGMERSSKNIPQAQHSIHSKNLPKSDSMFEYHRNRLPSTYGVSVSSLDIEKIEDLARATGEGYGKYLMATDTEEFARALIEAFNSMQGSKSSSGVAVTSNTLDTNTRAFRASFSPGQWEGDLVSTHLTVDPGGRTDKSWTLSKTFSTGEANAKFTERLVLRGKGAGASGATKFDDSFASAASALARTSGVDAVSIEDNIKWLRGEEINNLRNRTQPIGDIVNSTPAYSSDTQTVYVGANDGMLHAVDSDNARGKVLFSYIPGGVDLATLGKLSSPQYEHRFFVDGNIDVMTKAQHGSKTLLLAAMGRGGRGVFSLDVSDPKNMGSAQVLWDDTVPNSNTSYMPNMGYVLGRVHLRRVNGPSRKSVALIPNGIDSPNGCAALIVREINADGSAESAKTFSTGACGNNNGLMALALADLDQNGTVDLVYGGDLQGNVWRWDFRNGIPDPSATASKLFSGDSSRPITGGLAVSATLSGEHKIFVGFGTGRFISLSDVPNASNVGATQRLYGIIDHADDTPPLTLNDANLAERKMHISGNDRAFDPYEELPVDKEGWYVNLTPPERVIYPPNIAGSAMYITTAIPDINTALGGDDCDSAKGGGYVYAINLFTGTSPDISDSYFHLGPNKTATTMKINGVDVPIGGIANGGSIPTGVELLVGKDGEIEVLYDRGDGSLANEHGANLPNIEPEKKGRLSWREILRF